MLAVLVALAGCNLPGDTAAPADPTDGVTPAPVPEETYPPGLGTAGIQDARQLGAAHAAGIRNRSLTARYERRILLANGSTVRTLRSRMTVAGGWERFAGTTARGDPESLGYRAAMFSNRTARFVRQTTDGETRYGVYDSAERPWTWITERPSELLRALGRATVERTGTDPVRFRIRGSLAEDPGVLREETVSNATATFVVDGDGVVRRLRVAYDAEKHQSPGRERVVETAEVTDLGTTTVERPGWVAEADTIERPSGLGGNRVTDPAALLAGHREALVDEQVRVSRELRARTDADERQGRLLRRERARIGGERTTYYRSVDDGTATDDRAVWSNRTVSVTETVADGTTQYSVGPPVAFSVTGAVGPAGRELRDVLAGLGEARVDYQNRWYVVAADSVADPGLVVFGDPDRADAVANVSAELLIDRAGIVRSVRIEYRTVGNGTRVVERLEYNDGFRSGPISEPSWVAATLEDDGPEERLVLDRPD